MKATEFCYWLQGYFEIAEAGRDNLDPLPLLPNQVEMIQKHLNMVFIHDIDPSYPKEQQAALDDAHNGSAQTPTKPEAFAGFPSRPRC